MTRFNAHFERIPMKTDIFTVFLPMRNAHRHKGPNSNAYLQRIPLKTDIFTNAQFTVVLRSALGVALRYA